MSRPQDSAPAVPYPARRQLKTYAFDPMTTRLSGRWLDVTVPFEERLRPGPCGELVEVIDYDPIRKTWYTPIDLNDPAILARGGLRPSELDPRTHQQIVYAVAMGVIERFERFLGRRFRWRGKARLLLVPHAFEGRNAYFDPDANAVLFGYYDADLTDPGANLPGQRMFTCLSNDIVAHEVTHAIVHRLRPLYREATNPDVPALHEATADLVALFLHFTHPEVVTSAMQQARGDLSEGAGLFSLAEEFGHSTGRGTALRSAIRRSAPTAPGSRPARPERLDLVLEPHERGALLAAGVFDAFLAAYRADIADLLRIATGGSGILPPGHLHPDLVNRVSAEAVKNADRLLGMVIRGFDFLPPVDVEFGDVVRAIVTADRMLFPDDTRQLRAKLVEALRARGIHPQVSSLAEAALAWPAPPLSLTLGDPAHPVDLTALISSATHDLDRAGAAGVLPADSQAGDSDEDGPAAAAAERGPGDRFAAQLLAWARAHVYAIGLAPGEKLRLSGFHVSYWIAEDRQPHPIAVVQLHQRRRDLESALGQDPLIPEHLQTKLRAGTTLIARADGHVEHIIAKPLPLPEPELAQLPAELAKVATPYDDAGRARLERLLRSQAAIEAADALAPWLEAPAATRLTFARLHAALDLEEL